MRRWLRARGNILEAMPHRLFRAWMAQTRTPLFSSYLVNEPALVQGILRDRPAAFPKHPAQARAIGDLLGQSLFLANGADWDRQRRILDVALGDGFAARALPAMNRAAGAMVARLRARCGDGEAAVEIEAETSFAAADVILRVLFSQPISEPAARGLFADFNAYQRAAPLVQLSAILGLPGWLPRLGPRHRRQHRAAQAIRQRLSGLVAERSAAIVAGEAPQDVATALIGTRDAETGTDLTESQVADELALLMLAGHETSAAMLAWSLWLLAHRPDLQARLLPQVRARGHRAPLLRDVLRETLRLYPPVPFLLRRAGGPMAMRGRAVAVGSPVILSPWYLGRHERIWNCPHAFDPDRWATENGRAGLRHAWIPFSAGPRVCPGAGFAMQEGAVLLAALVRAFEVRPMRGHPVTPLAQLTLRAADGIALRLIPRQEGA
ncbi:MAG: cytochrome P450 [Pseudomonadota bacterium]